MKCNYKTRIKEQNENIHIESEDFKSQGIPTKWDNPKVRVAINVIALFILGQNFNGINRNYFTSLILFALPVLLDILGFKTIEKPRIVIRRLEKFLLGFIIFVCILGLSGTLNLVSLNGEMNIMFQAEFAIPIRWAIPAVYLYYLVWISYIIVICDIFASTTKAELKMNKYNKSNKK